MRKPLFRIWALSLALGLVSCGGRPVSPSSSGSGQESESSIPSHSADPDVVITPENQVNSTTIRTYEGPSLMQTSSEVAISVEGQPLFVYETLVNHGRVFSWIPPTTKAAAAIFDFEGLVHVEVEIASLVAPIQTEAFL